MPHPFDLPEILATDYAEELATHETEILDMAAALISQGAADEEDPLAQPLIRTHRDAVTLANELLYCHESASPADEGPRYCAEQLKLWHLRQLDIILSRFLKQD